MNLIYAGLLGLSLLSAALLGNGQALGKAVLEGAGAGVQTTLAIGGPLLLFSGLGKVMERAGITDMLSKFLRPLLCLWFPDMKKDPVLAGYISANFCANLLGLGNAATPMGIQAAIRLKHGREATDQLCRLVVLNTASIQLIPTSVAAIRAGLHCSTPFDILPAVWITSAVSAGLGLTAAFLLGKRWKHD